MTDSLRARADIARSAADHIERGASRRGGLAALVGFDGFIDAIIDVVDQRHDMSSTGYTRIKTIGQFAARAGAAAGKSTNLEMVVKEERWGGNGPLMAGALASLGLPVTYAGAVGSEESGGSLNPIYGELGRRCRRVIPVAAPSQTDALEFDDGKIMLGKTQNVQNVTWERLVKVVGLDEIRRTVASSALIGVVNWVMMGGVEGIWEGLIREILPRIERGDRRVFIDLCDPAKRTDADVKRAVGLLRRMNELVPVTLGLNLAEAERMAAVLGVGAFGGPANRTQGAAVEGAAVAIRSATGLACVAVHPREGAGAADAAGNSAWFDGPFTSTPRLSTGAGDHFNGGFAFGQALGLPLEECLAAGCAASGAYVRDAASPTLERLAAFLRELPEPQRAS